MYLSNIRQVVKSGETKIKPLDENIDTSV